MAKKPIYVWYESVNRMQIRSRLSIGQERKDLYMALADRSSSSINQKWSNTSRPVAVATTIQQIYKKKQETNGSSVNSVIYQNQERKRMRRRWKQHIHWIIMVVWKFDRNRKNRTREWEKKFFNVLLINDFFDIGLDRGSHAPARWIDSPKSTLWLHSLPSGRRNIFSNIIILVYRVK